MDKVELTQELVKIFGEEAEKQIRIAVDPGSVGPRTRELEERLARAITSRDYFMIYTQSPARSWVEKKALIGAINSSETIEDSLTILKHIQSESSTRNDLTGGKIKLLKKIQSQIKCFEQALDFRREVGGRYWRISTDQFLLLAISLARRFEDCLAALEPTDFGSHEEDLAVEKAISFVRGEADWVSLFKAVPEHSVHAYRCILAVKDILEKANPELPSAESA